MPFQPHSSVMTHNHKIVKLIPTPPTSLPLPLLLRTQFSFSAFILIFASLLRRQIFGDGKREKCCQPQCQWKNCMPCECWTNLMMKWQQRAKEKKRSQRTVKYSETIQICVSLRECQLVQYTTVFHCQHRCVYVCVCAVVVAAVIANELNCANNYDWNDKHTARLRERERERESDEQFHFE